MPGEIGHRPTKTSLRNSPVWGLWYARSRSTWTMA
jgi:hypothetical protein